MAHDLNDSIRASSAPGGHLVLGEENYAAMVHMFSIG